MLHACLGVARNSSLSRHSRNSEGRKVVEIQNMVLQNLKSSLLQLRDILIQQAHWAERD